MFHISLGEEKGEEEEEEEGEEVPQVTGPMFE
jgi:hypothetical protein